MGVRHSTASQPSRAASRTRSVWAPAVLATLVVGMTLCARRLHRSDEVLSALRGANFITRQQPTDSSVQEGVDWEVFFIKDNAPKIKHLLEQELSRCGGWQLIDADAAGDATWTRVRDDAQFIAFYPNSLDSPEPAETKCTIIRSKVQMIDIIFGLFH